MKKIILLISLIYLSHSSWCDEDAKETENVKESNEIEKLDYHRAQVESCPGCSLNRLKDVKQFIYEDVPKYDKVDFKKIQGAPPELVFYDKNDEEIERVDLRQLSREECNYVLVSRGFLLKLAARAAAAAKREEL